MRLHRVKECIHRGRNTYFSRLCSWKSLHIDHSLELGEHCGGVISSTKRTGEVSRMLGKEVQYEQIILATRGSC